jgi:hypothetical protein
MKAGCIRQRLCLLRNLYQKSSRVGTPRGNSQDIGRVKDTGSVSDSVVPGHVLAYFAVGRGKVRDDNDEDDDNNDDDDDDNDDGSVVTDNTSD